ncbi:MAG: accessory factor UbiK family protein [Legionellales bacterium]|nr:accessory factor UbiK family protein [Legionellales bacterium]
MLDTSFFDDMARKLRDALPDSVKRMEHDFERNFKDVLQTALSKLDLVTREEFDVQTKVLEHTREKVELLAEQLTQLELLYAKMTVAKPPKPKKKSKPTDH